MENDLQYKINTLRYDNKKLWTDFAKFATS